MKASVLLFLAVLFVSCHSAKQVHKKDKSLSVSTEKIKTVLLREDSLLAEVHAQHIFLSKPDSIGRQYIESIRATEIKAVKGASIKEQELKETVSIVQIESESEERAKRGFPLLYTVLIICVLVVVIVVVVYFFLFFKKRGKD